ncbi:MAG: flagellin [Myxococcota bacterium]
MPLTVNTNMASTNALTALGRTNRSLSSTFQRISSGLRITKAADDAAGLGVAENLSALTKGLGQAMRNTNDGVSMIEVAESSTNEVANIVKRMRELAVQSSSETLEDTERAYIDEEFTQLSSEVDRIANTVEFNGVKLGDGTVATINVQVGVMNTTDDQIAITTGDITAATLGIDTGSIDLSSSGGASTALTDLDDALNTLNGYRATYGSVQNRLESALRNMESYNEKLMGAESRIRDADYAFETSEMSKQQIMQQAGLAVLGQANQLNSGVTRLLG